MENCYRVQNCELRVYLMKPYITAGDILLSAESRKGTVRWRPNRDLSPDHTVPVRELAQSMGKLKLVINWIATSNSDTDTALTGVQSCLKSRPVIWFQHKFRVSNYTSHRIALEQSKIVQQSVAAKSESQIRCTRTCWICTTIEKKKLGEKGNAKCAPTWEVNSIKKH